MNRAFCIFVPPHRSDCDKCIVLACLSGGGSVGMVNDFCIEVWGNCDLTTANFLISWVSCSKVSIIATCVATWLVFPAAESVETSICDWGMDTVIGPLVNSITLSAEDASTSTELFSAMGTKIAFTWGGSLEEKSCFIRTLSAGISSASSLILRSNSLGMRSPNNVIN